VCVSSVAVGAIPLIIAVDEDVTPFVIPGMSSRISYVFVVSGFVTIVKSSWH